ncbi:DUF2842 domain-containing protein [Stakelama saccharophila]|uniref:DUF2842 domain-containing protein n=1 Tax=Stakelama saccharophila TaxID=3075605 RepID=A0ABZ0BCN1_9SPHN|nr:DUF2842 domain-containing protein [Stakelama sp. W311]WNO54990.1 DUF2842 domain-containing protein [Stakelama sp. W311]
MQPTWRKPAGALLILGLVIIWAILVGSLSPSISRLAWPLQTIVYAVAGIIWIAPLRPLLRWMETGRWRA